MNLFETDAKYSSSRNYFELFMLPSGQLFLSQSLMHEILDKAGIEGLVFVLLLELVHVRQKHVRANLFEQQKFGDLKKQMSLFTNQYTGIDALFIDYYTNNRFSLP